MENLTELFLMSPSATAFVAGPDASRCRFTSALPVAVLKPPAPAISQDLIVATANQQLVLDTGLAGGTYARTR